MERLRAAAIRDGTGFTLDIHVRTAKGNPRWLRLTVDVEQEDGRSVRIFGTKQDITEEKAAQEKVRALQAELMQASRRSEMGAMAATLAHEQIGRESWRGRVGSTLKSRWSPVN